MCSITDEKNDVGLLLTSIINKANSLSQRFLDYNGHKNYMGILSK